MSDTVPANPPGSLRDRLAAARYVSLATFRRDGREVRTPVWMASAEGRHFAFSARDSGKVRRLRHTARVRLAVCDWKGRVESDWREGEARLIEKDPASEVLAYRALRRRYGWQMALLDVLSRLSGRYHQRIVIELEF